MSPPDPPLLRTSAGGPAKAGNLLGTTRTCQPGRSGSLSASRSAHTSGGVMCSLPGQNGQPSGPRGAPTSPRNASGRAARPAVIATQPPLIGSWRSSPGALGRAWGGMVRVMGGSLEHRRAGCARAKGRPVAASWSAARTRSGTGHLLEAALKILVTVKRVPDTAAEKRLDPADKTLDRESVETILNPVDEY